MPIPNHVMTWDWHKTYPYPRARQLIEQFFSKRKQYRSVATRYGKKARNFLGAIHLAAAVIWLN